jgi:flagellar basal-body rod protein FlgB
MFGSGSIPVIEAVLQFSNQRQTVLVNNIANWNTPHYRARDLDAGGFREVLSRAIADRETGAAPLRIPTGRYVRRDPDGGLRLDSFKVATGALRHDGNSVVIDEEQTKLLKNALMAQTFNRLLARKFRALGSAISGRGSL